MLNIHIYASFFSLHYFKELKLNLKKIENNWGVFRGYFLAGFSFASSSGSFKANCHTVFFFVFFFVFFPVKRNNNHTFHTGSERCWGENFVAVAFSLMRRRLMRGRCSRCSTLVCLQIELNGFLRGMCHVHMATSQTLHIPSLRLWQEGMSGL